MTGEGSISFDRAASFYDATRGLPPEILAATCDAIAAELGTGPYLEIGIGTGRIALPLAARGIDVYGIDIAGAMLDKLRENAANVTPVHICLADATSLPFGDNSFGGAYAIHVLHLIASWPDAVREMVRVTRPGGALVFDVGSADPRRRGGWVGAVRELEQRFIAEAGIERRHPGITAIDDLDAVLAESDAPGHDLPPVAGSYHLPLSVILALFENGAFAFTWSVDEATRRSAAAAVRPWAERRFGDLDESRDLPVMVAPRVYRLPG